MSKRGSRKKGGVRESGRLAPVRGGGFEGGVHREGVWLKWHERKNTQFPGRDERGKRDRRTLCDEKEENNRERILNSNQTEKKKRK